MSELVFTDVSKPYLPEEYRDDFLAHLRGEPVAHQGEWSGHGAPEWRAASGSFPMSPGLGLQEVIREFGLVSVNAVSYAGVWIAHDTTGQPGYFGDFTCTYTILGVQNRRARYYFLDGGVRYIGVVMDVLDDDEPSHEPVS